MVASPELQNEGHMDVLNILNRANPDDVIRLYRRDWGDDDWSNPESFAQFKRVLNSLISVKTGMIAVIAPIPDAQGGNGRFEVEGDDGTGQHWSLALTPWEEWRAMDVYARSGRELSVEMLAMSLYYEMTFHGWPEDARAVRDKLGDMVEAIERGVEKGVPFGLGKNR